jgi:hypothetical protein
MESLNLESETCRHTLLEGRQFVRGLGIEVGRFEAIQKKYLAKDVAVRSTGAP